MFTMKSFLIVPSLMLLSDLVRADTSFLTWNRDVSLENKSFLSGHVLTSRSLLHCASACESDETCQSFFYLTQQLDNCVIHSTRLDSNSTGLTDVPGSAYYILETVRPNIGPTTDLSGVTYPTFSCPADDSVFRTVTLNDTSNTNMTYRVFKTLMNQADAAASCVSVGGFLARVTTTAKMDMLLALASCAGYSAGDYYIDGSNAHSGPTWDSWIMSNNEPVPMSNDFWGVGYPNNPGTQHCFRMRAAAGHYWDDCSCSNMYYFICEK